MPIFEYLCKRCGKKSEILIRNSEQKPQCECGSENLEKIFSSFAMPEASGHSGGCADGSCRLQPSSPCASGMCGLG